MDSITKKIKSLREEKGISKAKMSESLEIDPSNYNRYEKLGKDWTISQLQRIAVILGVSAAELITDGSQSFVNSEKVNELEVKISDLVKRLKDKEELLSFKDKQFELIGSQFQSYIYQQVAERAYEKGYSRIRFFERKTGKSIRYVTWEDNPEDISYQFIEDLIHTDINWHIKDILKKEPERGLKEEWEIGHDINLIPEYKQSAVNYFFSRLIGGGFTDEISLIMESGVITDELLLIAYKKAKAFEEDGYEDDEWVSENLELVKVPDDGIEAEWKGEEIRFLKKNTRKDTDKI